ncbi:5-oxoprolinase [Sphingobacterium haloxyli]|uniref:5-oxoprolinase n=1 Tax=Sphingobacterium haloxyli TaxID=2100533 RepID=A0A2S9J2J9_9SPHI|nr:5-oxoprolinase [Sphingobacterium haloxyli]PRD46992.1 5-oxoprolinase [Sphingobacterium haloxyli]
MDTRNELYNHLIKRFQDYSAEELVQLNNELVSGKWGTNRGTFRTAVLNALSKKGVDLSAIVHRCDGFTAIQIVPVALAENNVLIPLAE